jgi:hypothetical protein
MTLEVVACPEYESDLALAVCVLEAHGIPHFVHGGAFGALWPGPQIATWNTRRILVPAPLAEEAREALAELAALPVAAPEPAHVAAPHFLRLVLETFLLGWFVPRRATVRVEPDGPTA